MQKPVYYVVIKNSPILFGSYISNCKEKVLRELSSEQVYPTSEIIEGFENGYIYGLWIDGGEYIPISADILEIGSYFVYIDKVQKLTNQLLNMLGKFDFQGADDLYASSVYYITKSEYIQIKKPYIIQHIENILQKSDFQKADELYSNHGIKCIEIVEYVNIKKEYIINNLKSLLQTFDFQGADRISQNHGIKCIEMQEYVNIKKEYIVNNLKSLLQTFDFQGADGISQNHGIKCIEIGEYNLIKKEYIKKYFKDTDCRKLNDEKYEILADMSQYTLVKARAGTGKSTTLQHKIFFLHKAYDIDPSEMLLFSFNKKIAEEMNGKIQEGIIDMPDFSIPHFDGAMTFHRFAGQMMGLGREGRGKVLRNKDELINSIVISLIDEKPELKEGLYEYFKKEIDEIDKASLGMNLITYYEYIKDTQYEGQFTQETLNGETVKSVGEKRIADFLFEHDIEYKYESSIYANRANNLDETYHPDFVLTEFRTQEIDTHTFINQNIKIPGIEAFDRLIRADGTGLKTWMGANNIVQRGRVVIEHRGIKVDQQHTLPGRWKGTRQQYRDQMEWKRKFLCRQGYSLIETSIQKINHNSDTARSDFEDYLKQELERVGIICNKLPLDQLINKVIKDHQVRLGELCDQYITKAKQLGKSPTHLSNETQSIVGISEKSQMFYKFANIVYERYQTELKNSEKRYRDMEDMLEQGYEALQNDSFHKIKRKDENGRAIQLDLHNNSIKYIFVDEFQDCNRLFYHLIKGILQYNPNTKLICVGDDRQLINGFAGSRIEFFRDYHSNFKTTTGNSTTLFIRETFRCPKEICKVANDFYGEEGGSYSNKSRYEIKGYCIDSSEYYYIENNQNNTDQYEYYNQFFPKKKMYKRNEKGELIKDKNGNKISIKDDQGNDVYEVDRKPYNIGYARYLRHLFEICKSNFNLERIFILSRFKKNIFGHMVGSVKKHLYELLKKWYIENNNIGTNEVNDTLDKKIQFMTIHKSKGQEADLVILIEIGTTKFPFLHPDNELNAIFGETIQDVLDEEKRLFYVALTRTKNKLYYLSEKEIPAGLDHGKFLIDSWGKSL